MFDDLINYYRTSRRVGHTTLLVDATVDYLRRRPYDSLVVFVADAEDTYRIKREIEIAYAAKDDSKHAGPFNATRVRVLSIRSARDALGLRRPALIDNHAMEILLTEFDVEPGCRRARIDALGEELGIEKRKSAALAERLKNHEGWLDEKREAVRAAEARVADLEERLEDMEARAGSLEATARDLREQLPVAVDVLRNQLAAQARIADLERRLDEKLRDCTALEHRATRAESLPADFTIDGKSVADVLTPDAAVGHPAQDVLHAIAREFGWRTDWSTGSPITLQSVVGEIRERHAACEQAGLRTIEADARRIDAERQRQNSDLLLALMIKDYESDTPSTASPAELRAVLGRLEAVGRELREGLQDDERTKLKADLARAWRAVDVLRGAVEALKKQVAAEQDARLVAEAQAADLEGQLDEIGERDGDAEAP